MDEGLQECLLFFCKEQLKVVIEIHLILQDHYWLILALDFGVATGVDYAIQVFDCLLKDCMRGELPSRLGMLAR